MKINGLHIDGFGVWRDLKVEGIPGGMTVFFGRNEAGKSTLMQFIRTGFFGFSQKRREKYVPPVYGGQPGGTLFLDRVEGPVAIQRHADLSRLDNEFGNVLVTTDEGSASGQNRLATMMSDVDEAIFSHVFAIGLQEIQELGALNDTQAADHLYRLTSGLDRVSLIDVLREIRSNRLELSNWKDGQFKGQIRQYLDRRKGLIQEIDQLIAGGRRWAKIAANASDLSRQLAKIDFDLTDKESVSRKMEMGIQIAPRWQDRKVIERQIAGFGNLTDESLIDIPRLDSLKKSIDKQKQEIDKLNIERKHLKENVNSIGINRVLWKNRTRIQALGEHLPWLDALDREIESINDEKRTFETDLKEASESLKRDLGMKSRDVRSLSKSSLSTLRSIARDIKEERNRYRRSQDEAAQAEIEVRHSKKSLDASRGHAGIRAGMPSTMEDTARLIDRLKQRGQLDEKIEKLEERRRNLQHDMDEVIEEQNLNPGQLTGVLVLFFGGILCFAFILFGTLGYLDERWAFGFQIGLLAFIVGILLLGGAATFKMRFDQANQDELNDFLHQVDLIRQQIKRARELRDEIEAELPPGISHWETRLKEAENQIVQMEDIIPQENKLRVNEQHLETLRLRTQKIESGLKKAQKHWRETLKSIGLPPHLKPAEMKDISRQMEIIAEYRESLESLNGRLSDKESERQVLCGRIHSLSEETSIGQDQTDPRLCLDVMKLELQDQRELIQRREKLAVEFKQLRAQYNKEKTQLEKVLSSKRRLLNAAGASTEEQFREFSLQHSQYKSLVEKQEIVDQQIQAALGGHFQWDEIIDLIDSNGQAGLERLWETTLQEIEQLKEKKSDLNLQRGKMIQEMETLSEDDRLEVARLELEEVDQQIKDLKGQWQELAANNFFLETIREQHEKQRQPETLREASSYLERLTDGQYVRIWTRLVGEQLLVDTGTGDSINVELLSRGTREAVYLALRMSLVSAYARRGVVLPMVLDDVLVNFDSDRLHLAAKVLAEFAGGGYQILMFTCHHHIHKAFSSNGVSVQVLPHHRDVVTTDGEGTVVVVDGFDKWDHLIEEAPEQEPVETEPVAAVPAEPESFDMWWEPGEEEAS